MGEPIDHVLYLLKADCQLTEWGDWTACSRTCDTGTRQRTREVYQRGEGCTEKLEEEESCNKDPCCLTKEGEACQFPFHYKGETHNSCIPPTWDEVLQGNATHKCRTVNGNRQQCRDNCQRKEQVSVKETLVCCGNGCLRCRVPQEPNKGHYTSLQFPCLIVFPHHEILTCSQIYSQESSGEWRLWTIVVVMVVFLDFAVAAVTHKMTATQLELLSLRHDIELKKMIQASPSGNNSCTECTILFHFWVTHFTNITFIRLSLAGSTNNHEDFLPANFESI